MPRKPPQQLHPNRKEPSLRATIKKPKQPQAAYDLPDWLDQTIWTEFAAMRLRKRAPLTAFAAGLIFTELIKLSDDPATRHAILNQSTRSSWTDVYPLKTNGASHAPAQQLSAVERVRAAAARRKAEAVR